MQALDNRGQQYSEMFCIWTETAGDIKCCRGRKRPGNGCKGHLRGLAYQHMRSQINGCLNCTLYIEDKDIFIVDVVQSGGVKPGHVLDTLQATLNRSYPCQDNITVHGITRRWITASSAGWRMRLKSA